jgi:uncharacterized protein GlcG (DUF336 family)
MSKYAYGLAAAAVAAALATPADAQLLARKDLSLATALTVVGRNGEVIVQLRGDNTGPHTMENSFRKAYTSRTFRIPSGEMTKRLKDNPTLGTVHLSNIIALAGALQIKIGEETIGAIGVSGAPGGEKDEVCAQAGIDKVADQLK